MLVYLQNWKLKTPREGERGVKGEVDAYGKP
jgi:hypothetical protein